MKTRSLNFFAATSRGSSLFVLTLHAMKSKAATFFRTFRLPLVLCAIFALYGCRKQPARAIGFADPVAADTATTAYDLGDIQTGGELIVGTLFGPQSYFEYRGGYWGLQYRLAQDFAVSEGLKLRVEAVRDTLSLYQMLSKGQIDLIAYPLPLADLKQRGLVAGGYVVGAAPNSKSKPSAWAVRPSAPDLLAALDAWYDPDRLRPILSQGSLPHGPVFKHRHVYAPYQSRGKGIISRYDHHFKRYSRQVGWDWRLLAAQCYQESGFDERAVSWAGARGLMQIMPGTARQLNLAEEDLFRAEANIEAGVRYIGQLSRRFADVPGRLDRICFVLAAYNGGYYHIRDAMNLARKNHRNPTRWTDVAPYVLGLSRPQYYRDPVVRYGYMVGSETYGYVNAIMARWRKYQSGASVAPLTDGDSYFTPTRASRRNRFSRKQQILSPNDSAFMAP